MTPFVIAELDNSRKYKHVTLVEFYLFSKKKENVGGVNWMGLWMLNKFGIPVGNVWLSTIHILNFLAQSSMFCKTTRKIGRI